MMPILGAMCTLLSAAHAGACPWPAIAGLRLHDVRSRAIVREAVLADPAGSAHPALDLVLVDGRLARVDLLVAAILPGCHVMVFDAEGVRSEDLLLGIHQILSRCDARLHSLSIISHGRSGRFGLGRDEVSGAGLTEPGEAWRNLASRFTHDGVIRIYGCDVASGAPGSELLHRLSLLTGAAVYASDDRTGAGGDWRLEVRTASAHRGAPAEVLDARRLQRYPASLAQTQVNLSAVADSYIDAYVPTTNYGSNTSLRVRRWLSNWSRRGLVAFDLSSIPAGATIDSATLKLVISLNSGHAKTVNVHEATRAWVENQVTWQIAATGTNWTATGGDFVSTATDSEVISPFDPAGTVLSFDVTNDVRDFHSGASTNYGWLIKDSLEPTTGSGELVDFGSREHGTSSYRPVLEVVYTASAGITVSSISGATTEAGGTATFTVVLISQPTANVTIGLSSSNTAEGTMSPSSLTFTSANWNVAQTVTVTGVNDAVDDGNVAYTIVTAAATSSDSDYNGLNASDVAVTNQDDDTAGVTVSAISGPTTEAGGSASFTLVLTSQPTASVTVNLSSSDTTEGTVSPASATFTTSNWNVAQTVTVTGVDDAVDDGNIAYTIVTAASSGDAQYNGISVADVAATNNDDDSADVTVSSISGPTTEAGGTASFTLVLTSQPAASVTISLSSSDTTEGTVSPSSVTFTTSNWNVAQTLQVTGVNDAEDDGNIAYTIVTSASSSDAQYNGISVADVAATNNDDDTAGVTVSGISGATTEAGGSASFTLVLTSQPLATVTISLSSSDTTEGTVSPASASFTNANWNSAQTIQVTGVDDAVDDGNIAYTIVTTASSADAQYNGISVADVAVTNQDNDTAAVNASAVSGPTTEAGGTATFTVALNSQPVSDVTVSVSSSIPSEGAALPASLTFTTANWSTVQTITVTGVDDAVMDGPRVYNVVLTASGGDPVYSGLSPVQVAVTNTDDDVAGITLTQTGGSTTAAEGDGSTDTYTLVLTSQPTANVQITAAPDSQLELNGANAPLVLTFTAANWNVAQTVTVAAVNDVVVEGAHAGTVAHSVSSGDNDYDQFNVASVTATITDNDTPPPPAIGAPHPPAAEEQAVNVFEDEALEILLQGSGLDGAPQYFITRGPSHGVLTGNPPAVIYVPESDFSGSDSFEFVVSRGDVVSDPATVVLEILGLNDPPTAYEGAARLEAGSLDYRIELSVTDPDGADALKLMIVTPPAHGELSLEPLHPAESLSDCLADRPRTPPRSSPSEEWSVYYSPDAGFAGRDAFTWAVSDGVLESEPVRFELHVVSAPQAPFVQDQQVSVLRNSSGTRIELSGSPADPERVLQFVIVALPERGVLRDPLTGEPIEPEQLPWTLAAGNLVDYAPQPDDLGADEFRWYASDGLGRSPLATVFITVQHAIVGILAEDVSARVPGDASCVQIVLTGEAIGGDTAIESDIVSLPAHGRLVDPLSQHALWVDDLPYRLGPDARVVYLADDGFAGTDSFDWQATDGILISDPARVIIEVERRPEPPEEPSDEPNVPDGRASWSLCGSLGLIELALLTGLSPWLRRRKPRSLQPALPRQPSGRTFTGRSRMNHPLRPQAPPMAELRRIHP